MHYIETGNDRMECSNNVVGTRETLNGISRRLVFLRALHHVAEHTYPTIQIFDKSLATENCKEKSKEMTIPIDMPFDTKLWN